MSKIETTVGQITQQVATYVPSAIAAVQVIEAAGTGLSGPQKQQLAVQAIIAGTGALASSPDANKTASGFAALVNLTVSILNMLGVFSHKGA